MGLIQKSHFTLRRQSVLFFILAFFVASSIVQLLPQTTYATVDKDNLSDYANAATLYYGFSWCMSEKSTQYHDGADSDLIENNNAKSGTWWVEGFAANSFGTAWGVSSYLTGAANQADGVLSCNNIVKQGVKAWGFTDPLNLLCEAKVYRANGESCANGSDAFKLNWDNQVALQNAIKAKAFSGAEPKLTGAHNYLLYRTAFTKGCQAVASNSGKDDRNYTGVKAVDDATGAITPTRYEAAKKGNKKFVYANSKQDRVETTCLQIAAGMNQYADAYSKWIKDWIERNPDQAPPTQGSTQPDGDSDADTGTSCSIDGIGWLLCPAVTFIAAAVDGAYSFVSKFLVVQPLTFNNTNDPLYQSWNAIRNIANIAFVIAFMLIIFSQLTGFGISNYGIKKMLPKIIIAAILVNLSYIVCAIAVDLSNILGGTLRDLIENAGGIQSDFTNGKDHTVWTNLAGPLLAGGATVGISLYVGLSAFIPAIISAAIAILLVVLVLIIRQALIILLIVIAPLAFVAFLLPNTESWFDRWRKFFVALLLVYPVIALVFGASALASTIVMNAAQSSFLMQIMGAAISVVPLFITPIIMKASGGVLNRFAGIVNDRTKGPLDAIRNRGDRLRKNQESRRTIRALNGGRVFPGRGASYRRQARSSAIDASLQRLQGNAQTQYVASATTDDDNEATAFAKRLAGGMPVTGAGYEQAALQSALANARFTIDEATAKEIKAESVMVQNLNKDQLKMTLDDKNATETETRKAAAMQRLIKISDPEDYSKYVNNVIQGEKNETLRRATAQALGENGPGILKASDLDNIATGNDKTYKDKKGNDTGVPITLESLSRNNARANVMSAEKMVASSGSDLDYIYENADAQGKQNLRAAATEALKNDDLKTKIKHNKANIEKIRQGGVSQQQSTNRENAESAPAAPDIAARNNTSENQQTSTNQSQAKPAPAAPQADPLVQRDSGLWVRRSVNQPDNSPTDNTPR